MVGERVPVVGGRRQDEHELVGEQNADRRDEDGTHGVGDDLADRRRRGAHGKTWPPARQPRTEREGEQHAFGSREARSGDGVQRRECPGDEPEIGDEREVGGENGRDEAR